MSTLRLAPPLLCAGAVFAAAPAGAASLILPIGPVYDNRIDITVPRPPTRPVTLSRLSLQAFGSLEAFRTSPPDAEFSMRVSGFGDTVVTYANLGTLFNGFEADDMFDLPGDVGRDGVPTPVFSTNNAIMLPSDGRNAVISSILIVDAPLEGFFPSESPFTPPPNRPFFFAIQGEAVIEFDDAVWTAPAGGAWDDDANWSIGEAPGGFVDIGYTDVVLIDPEISQTIDGPEGLSELASLRLGGGAGRATLAMQGGAVATEDGVLIAENGVLTGAGTIGAGDGVENRGEIDGGGLTVDGAMENAGLFGGGGVVRGRFVNDGDGVVALRDGDTLRLLDGPGAADAPNANAGDIRVLDSTLISAPAFRNAAGGVIDARDAFFDFAGGFENAGEIRFGGGVNDVFGDVENGPDGAIVNFGALTFWDDVLNAGEIEAVAGSSLIFAGVYTGSGAVTGDAEVRIRGAFSPGSSPGLSTFGALTLESTSESLFELGGTERGVTYDATDVSGALTLGGDLTVVNFDGFLAKPGDRFTLFMAAQILGDFASISLPDLASGQFRVFRTDTAFGVQAVPLPAAGWMLLAGLGALAALRRRAA